MTDYEVIEDLKYYGMSMDALNPKTQARLIKDNVNLLRCIYSVKPLVRQYLISDEAIDAEFEEKEIENEAS